MTDQPGLHQTILPCNHAHLRQTHVPHSWDPQPGVQPVFCTGYVPDDGQWHYDTPPRGSSPNRWRTPALGSALPHFTYRPVTPEMEQAATQRAVEAAQQRESEQVGFTLGSGREFLASLPFGTAGPATMGIVGRDGQPLVTIHVDEQRIEYGSGYTPDAAATAFWDAIRGLIPRPATSRIDVAGRCPACKGNSLFLGDGGYVTCSRIDCPEPDAAHTAIETAAEGPK